MINYTTVTYEVRLSNEHNKSANTKLHGPLLAAAGGVKKTIQKNREQTEKKQVAGAGFKGPLLTFLLNLTLTAKSASHTSQFTVRRPYIILL